MFALNPLSISLGSSSSYISSAHNSSAHKICKKLISQHTKLTHKLGIEEKEVKAVPLLTFFKDKLQKR